MTCPAKPLDFRLAVPGQKQISRAARRARSALVHLKSHIAALNECAAPVFKQAEKWITAFIADLQAEISEKALHRVEVRGRKLQEARRGRGLSGLRGCSYPPFSYLLECKASARSTKGPSFAILSAKTGFCEFFYSQIPRFCLRFTRDAPPLPAEQFLRSSRKHHNP